MKYMILILMAVLLIAVVPTEASAQQQSRPPAAIAFQIDLDETVLQRALRTYSEQEITIKVYDKLVTQPVRTAVINLSSDYSGYLYPPDTPTIETDIEYQLKEHVDRWLRWRYRGIDIFLNTSIQGWDVTKGYVKVTSIDGTLHLILSLPLAPSRYQISVTSSVTSSDNTPRQETLFNKVEDVASHQQKDIRITSTSWLDPIIEGLFTERSGLIALASVLGVALLGALKDRLVRGFDTLLDIMGKYSRGKLAERRFLKRYINTVIRDHRYLRVIGFINQSTL